MMTYEIEQELAQQGFTAICGVDEAGRGPLCGPVVAAACILPVGLEIPGLNDSKKLTEKRREALFDTIRTHAVAYAVAQAIVEEIDRLNILTAILHVIFRCLHVRSSTEMRFLPPSPPHPFLQKSHGISCVWSLTGNTRSTASRNTKDTAPKNI